MVNYFVENLDKDVDLDMIEILGGNFSKGSNTEEALKAWKNGSEEMNRQLSFDIFAMETPARKVTNKPFFMSKYEVT